MTSNGTSLQQKPDPCSFVIFGVTGDLAHRLVMPALYNLAATGLLAAARIAAVTPGQYRELAIGADGAVAEPAMVPVQRPGGAAFPLGQGDVVLISRGSGAAGLTLAQVLACSGAAVAMIGRGGAGSARQDRRAAKRQRAEPPGRAEMRHACPPAQAGVRDSAPAAAPCRSRG